MKNTRFDFPMLDKDIIYFDNGATTFKPDYVINSITDYYKNYSANAHRGDYAISYKVDVAYESSRKKVADFINADFEEVIFTSGATESLNMVAEGFFKYILEPGDEVVITKSEHASNVLPWFRLAKTNNIVIKYIELDENLHVTMDNVTYAVYTLNQDIDIAGEIIIDDTVITENFLLQGSSEDMESLVTLYVKDFGIKDSCHAINNS